VRPHAEGRAFDPAQDQRRLRVVEVELERNAGLDVEEPSVAVQPRMEAVAARGHQVEVELVARVEGELTA